MNIFRMYLVVVCCTLAAACTTTQMAEIDTKIADVNSRLYKYCVYLQGASMIAATALENNTLANRIDAGIVEYCRSDVKDVPTAIAKLTSIYFQAVNAGVKPSTTF